jgi:hypothetical protein
MTEPFAPIPGLRLGHDSVIVPFLGKAIEIANVT